MKHNIKEQPLHFSSILPPTSVMSSDNSEIRDALGTLRNKYSHARMTNCDARIEATSDEYNLDFLRGLKLSYSHQPLFLQSVIGMAMSLKPMFDDPVNGNFFKKVFLIIAEPERIISFRVDWEDDQGNMICNRGWRVEFSSAMGPYKGGVRFHSTVDEDVLKFLGWEQMFKNALTGLPLGAAMDGSNFDPKGKSNREIRHFCQSFIKELYRYLHPLTGVPIGDIGVGVHECEYLLGQYHLMLTKQSSFGLTVTSVPKVSSSIQTKATGNGLAHMAKIAIEDVGDTLENTVCLVSGSGNVAQHAAKRLIEMGAKVVTMSDSNGVIVFKDGMTIMEWQAIAELKRNGRGPLSKLVIGEYIRNHTPWDLSFHRCDFAFPCATQNEINILGIENLLKRGMKGIFEGAHMPITLDAQKLIRKAKVLYISGKAANAGGIIAGSVQNGQMSIQWTEEHVESQMENIMEEIYKNIKVGEGDIINNINSISFLRVAKAMKQLGWVY